MCGINGTLVTNKDISSIDKNLLIKMRDTMLHRGPNGHGVWINDNGLVGFGHRRLSIIDLSDSATQPMSTNDEQIWITFNGEIYNHKELRDELNTLYDINWKTDHSDTEVIIYAYKYWGIDCIKKFKGMFAFALWDNIESNLYLVRDRIGIKPIYFSALDGHINFASEIKALLKDPTQKRKVNETAFFHYLSFLTSPAPDTLFEGIKKIPAGTYYKIDLNGKIEEKKYWDILDNTKDLKNKNEDEISLEILKALKNSVAIRKTSDVPVGVFLSGGIDSSTNSALFSSNGEKVKTFTIGYDEDYESYQNETGFARYMANKIGAEYFEKKLSVKDLIEFLPLMIKLQDEPISDPVCFPVYYVSKLAKENGVTVCQVGEGADELFWGYPSWKIKLYLQRINNIPLLGWFKKLILIAMKIIKLDKTLQFEWLKRGYNNQPIFWGGAESFTHNEKMAVLSERLRKKFSNYSSWEAIKPIMYNYNKKTKIKSDLNWMTYLDLNLRLPELLLMRVDKMSMGVSLEGRVPFLDHELAELAISIPEPIKTKRGILKYILKKSVRGVIPDKIIDREKQGFGVPIYDWFFDELGSKAKKDLEKFAQETDYIDPLEVSNLFKEKKMRQVWYLLNFSLWWNEYIKGHGD